jgi:hypothetical protein
MALVVPSCRRAPGAGESVSKADRISSGQLRAMRVSQRTAALKLRDDCLGPAERAREKQALGWRRTREETLALVRQLIAAGRREGVVAREAGVSLHYLRRLLKEQGEDAEDQGLNPSIHAAKTALTNNGKVIPHSRPCRGAAEQYPVCGTCPKCWAQSRRLVGAA